MKSAPQALKCLLALHARKGDQTCELKAYALQKSPQNIRLRSKGVRSRMLGCPGCCMEHADRLLSASSWALGNSLSVVVYPSVGKLYMSLSLTNDFF